MKLYEPISNDDISCLLSPAAQNTFSVLCKCIEVSLEKDGGSYGFTLRGGVQTEPSKCRPLTVTQIRPGGAADRWVCNAVILNSVVRGCSKLPYIKR